MFEEIYARQRSGNRGSILDDIPATMNPTEKVDINNHNLNRNGAGSSSGGSALDALLAELDAEENQVVNPLPNNAEQKQDTQIFSGYSNDN